MINIFRKILKELPPAKIKIVPDEPKDKEVADRMSDLVNWKVAQDRNDLYKEIQEPPKD